MSCTSPSARFAARCSAPAAGAQRRRPMPHPLCSTRSGLLRMSQSCLRRTTSGALAALRPRQPTRLCSSARAHQLRQAIPVLPADHCCLQHRAQQRVAAHGAHARGAALCLAVRLHATVPRAHCRVAGHWRPDARVRDTAGGDCEGLGPGARVWSGWHADHAGRRSACSARLRRAYAALRDAPPCRRCRACRVCRPCQVRTPESPPRLRHLAHLGMRRGSGNCTVM